MNYRQTCKHCNTSTALSTYLCPNCKYVLHDRVPDLNIQKVVSGIFWNPSETLTYILQSERKNMLPLILFFGSVKFYTTALIILGQTGKGQPFSIGFTILSSVITLLVITLSAGFLKVVWGKGEEREKSFKNYFSLLVYSLIPAALSLPLLQTLEYSFFGEYIFVPIPSPLVINPAVTILFLILELVALLFSVIVSYKAISILTNGNKFSLILALFPVSASIILNYLALTAF